MYNINSIYTYRSFRYTRYQCRSVGTQCRASAHRDMSQVTRMRCWMPSIGINIGRWWTGWGTGNLGRDGLGRDCALCLRTCVGIRHTRLTGHAGYFNDQGARRGWRQRRWGDYNDTRTWMVLEGWRESVQWLQRRIWPCGKKAAGPVHCGRRYR